MTHLILYQPPVALGKDQVIENQQSLTQIIEPYTQTYTTPSTLPLESKIISNVEGEEVSASRALDKGISMSVPAALSPVKSSKIETETTVSPSIFSQKNIDLQMAKLLLGSFSQQSESIEFGLSARATCIVSTSSGHLQTLLTINEYFKCTVRNVTH